jgi:hypothetical protein
MADTDYTVAGGLPTPGTVQRAWDDADLNRAVQAYRFCFPTVSGLAIFKGKGAIGGCSRTKPSGCWTPSPPRPG